MIREMGNVELFENNSKSAMLSGSSPNLTNGDWDTLSIPHNVIKKGRARQNRSTEESILWPTTRGRDVSKRIMMEFTIVYNEIQHIVIRNSKLAGPRRPMEKVARRDHSYRPSYEENERYQKHWYLILNKSCKNAPMRLRSDFRTAATFMNRLHRESGGERPEPIPFQQYQRWHPSSSSSPWWNWDKNQWIS